MTSKPKKTKKPTKKASKPQQKTPKMKMSFLAEIAETTQRKSATTLDQTYSLKVRTNDYNILDLGKLPAQTLIKVTIEIADRDKVRLNPDKDKYYE